MPPSRRHQLWPLLPPLVVPSIMLLFISVSDKLNGPLAKCALHEFTGAHCPGCGGTRCARSILNGRWLEALSHNVLLTAGFLAFITLCIYLIIRITLLGKPAPAIPHITSRHMWIALGIITLFTILRNLNALSWLAP